jgi:hypothetical protein
MMRRRRQPPPLDPWAPTIVGVQTPIIIPAHPQPPPEPPTRSDVTVLTERHGVPVYEFKMSADWTPPTVIDGGRP